MNAADKQIAEILSKFGEDFASNTWPVPGGKARAILHKCIERMVAKAGIWFDPPSVIRSDIDNVALVVTGHMGAKDGDREEWSFGEASPKNNKNAYPFAMAEKRAKDRVALKLIGLHGLLYSEEEADEFRQGKSDPVDADEDGVVVLAPEELIRALDDVKSRQDLKNWQAAAEVTLASYPEALAKVDTAYDTWKSKMVRTGK